jgi:hypothetical protein
MRDSWDLSDDGEQLKTLTCTVAAYKRHASGEERLFLQERRQMWTTNERGERTHILDQSKLKLKALQDFRKKTFADKLQKARQT